MHALKTKPSNINHDETNNMFSSNSKKKKSVHTVNEEMHDKQLKVPSFFC